MRIIIKLAELFTFEATIFSKNLTREELAINENSFS